MNINFLSKKNRVTALSFFNSAVNLLLKDVSFFRFDIYEQAFLTGKKSVLEVTADDIIRITTGNKLSIPLFTDIPADLIYSDTIVNNLIQFYLKTNSFGLSIDLKYSNLQIARKISHEEIPIIAYSNNPNDYDSIKDNCIEMQSQGVKAIILEKFDPAFVEMLKNTLQVPVISDKGKKNDGTYNKISDVIGLSNSPEKMLNFNELFILTINDLLFQNNK